MPFLRGLLLFVVVSLVLVEANAADEPAVTGPTKLDVTTLIVGGLLDPSAPIDRRKELAAELLDAADREDDAFLFYLAGSLYRQGDQLGIAPFKQDIDAARKWLTRSAIAGHVPAMGKLAAMELDVGNVFEGNLWAQLYARYGKQTRPGGRQYGDAVALLGRALPLLPATDQPRLLERRNAFLGEHDKAIQEFLLEARKPNPHHALFAGLRMHGAKPISADKATKALQGINGSGVAEYFVEFDRAGKLVKVWSFDAWPSNLLLEWMRQPVETLSVDRAKKDAPDRRITLLPMSYVDPTSKLLPKGFAPGK